ncbi:hypothetical protein BaRGS_00037553 [Batillaria attramentaria]|uniref:Ig-like domain-containing protein n=1 Tax=Batillaria attramentaria TaxID=370345 RepID=A0ABD0J8V8_9CAEN
MVLEGTEITFWDVFSVRVVSPVWPGGFRHWYSGGATANLAVAWRRIKDDQFLTIGKITWFQDSNLVLEHLRKGSGVSSWDLILRRAQPEQAGDYECQITSTAKHVRTVTLTVIDEPIFQKAMLIYSGNTIHLVCNISADNGSDFDLRWRKNGLEVDSDKFPWIVVTRYQIQESQTFVSDLIIDNASQQDSGVYSCRSGDELVDSTKITVIKKEARSDLVPDPVDGMMDEHNMLEEHSSYYSKSKGTDSLHTYSSNSSSQTLHKPTLWTVLSLPLLGMWTLLLRDDLTLFLLPAS